MRSRFAKLAASMGHAHARHLLVACGLLLGLALAATGAWVIGELRSDHISHAEQDMTRMSFVLATELDRELQGIDLLAVSLIEHMRQLGIDSPDAFEQQMKPIEVHQDLARRIAGLPHIAALSLHDRNGTLINFSRSWPAPQIDVRDRDFIRVLLAPNPPETVISEPVQSKTTGKWTIYFSRRFEASDGTLIGIVVSSIVGDYFEQLFAKLAVDDADAFGLYRSDGMLLVRYPHADPKIGMTFGQTENYTRMLGVVDHGIARLTSELDGEDRLVAGHTVAHYPAVISVSDTVDSILEAWRNEARAFGSVIGFLELVIAVTVLLAVRHLRAYELLQVAEAARTCAEERERGARRLHTQGLRFDLALNNMQQGLLMFDHAGLLLVVNRRFCTLFGVPEGVLAPGMTYDEVTEQVVTEGNVTAEDMREVRERRVGLVERNQHATATWELANGRAFTMTYQPMADGWLGTFEEITERREAEARIAHLARHDALTDLPNRVQLREKLNQALVVARRGGLLALHCLDLDQFKAVNDTLGHPIGDGLLQAVAQRLRQGVRKTDTVARLGGDEFAIVQAEIDSPIEATELASRLVESIEAPFEIEGQQIVIGTSIGIAFAPRDGLDADQLLKCADLALYRAKVDGRGVYRLFQAEMDAAMQVRRVMELDLRLALQANQLEVFYQPLIDVRNRRVAGFEALLRWRHPTKGLVQPNLFIPLAEETGMIIPIGEWVLQQACVDATAWPNALKVAVNLSAVQFKSRNLIASVTGALRQSGLAPERLELEITETVMLKDTAATLATLHQLQDLGIQIAMDDFGTGYSSLSYLRRFPFDRIKIDQSFVRDLGKRADCIAIVRAVTALGTELGMAITAEGVETRQQLETVERAGCTEAQGYLFGPAVPGCAVPDLLRAIADKLLPHGARPVAEPVG
jgi:diguanylate cyclase (GGDEF)-like protein